MNFFTISISSTTGTYASEAGKVQGHNCFLLFQTWAGTSHRCIKKSGSLCFSTQHYILRCVCACSVCDLMEYSLPASSVHGIFQARTLKRHALFQGIFLTQRSNPHLLHLPCWEADSLPLSHLGSPVLKYSSYTLLQTTKCGFLVCKHGIAFFPHDARLSATPLTIYESFHPFSTFSPRPGIRLLLLQLLLLPS